MAVVEWSSAEYVNSTGDLVQMSPVVAAMAGGGYAIVWLDDNKGFVGFQRFNDAGEPQGSQVWITYPASAATSPALVATPDGGFVLSMMVPSLNATDDEDAKDLVAVRLYADGSLNGSFFPLLAGSSPFSEAEVELTTVGTNIAATFVSDGVVRGVVLNPALEQGGTEFTISTTALGSLHEPHLAGLAGGSIAVVWTDVETNTASVRLRLLDPAGNALAGFEQDVLIADSGGNELGHPKVAALAGGGFVVSWEAWDRTTTNIVARMYDSAGNSVGQPVVVNQTLLGDQYIPEIIGLKSGGFAVAWYDSSADGVYVRVFDAEGAALSDEFQVNKQPTLIYVNPEQLSLAELADGRLVVSWRAPDGYLDDNGILQRIVDPRNGTVMGSDGDDLLYGNEVYADTIDGGAGHDTLVGLAGDDLLVGGDGNDTLQADTGQDSLYGGAGHDTMVGGDGADLLQGGAGDDYAGIFFPVSGDYADGGDGTDTLAVRADSSATGVTIYASDGTVAFNATVIGVNFEAFTFRGSNGNDVLQGDEGNDYLRGEGGNDSLMGSGGDDTLNGEAGTDTLLGGLGNDTYILITSGDSVAENASGGTDTVQAGYHFTLGSNLENLLLTGTAALDGTGNSLANTLTGNSGANTLDGGTGADTLTGGLGNDTYVLASSGDTVMEGSNAGTDTVRAGYSYALGSNLENLVLTGSSVIHATGNGLANTLTGNGSANTLDGGTGADRLEGGLGNDTYVLATTGDTVVEAASAGTDTVRAAYSLTLGLNIEHLVLTGSSALNGTGNSLANKLTGNSGANTLKGGDGKDTLDGGTGADRLEGGLGNDTYVLATSGDTVVEAASAGTDTVQAGYTAALGANLENLVLTGTAAIHGTGNTLANKLTGNSGANSLTGGSGNDTLTGGSGDDAFLFNAALNGTTNVDTIRDMNEAGNDVIRLENAVFTALVQTGVLSTAAFKSNLTGLAEDSSDRIIFEKDTGEIHYDSNGSTTGGTYVLFAKVDANSTLTAGDFAVF